METCVYPSHLSYQLGMLPIKVEHWSHLTARMLRISSKMSVLGTTASISNTNLTALYCYSSCRKWLWWITLNRVCWILPGGVCNVSQQKQLVKPAKKNRSKPIRELGSLASTKTIKSSVQNMRMPQLTTGKESDVFLQMGNNLQWFMVNYAMKIMHTITMAEEINWN